VDLASSHSNQLLSLRRNLDNGVSRQRGGLPWFSLLHIHTGHAMTRVAAGRRGSSAAIGMVLFLVQAVEPKPVVEWRQAPSEMSRSKAEAKPHSQRD
jgi:hypothetical protein